MYILQSLAITATISSCIGVLCWYYYEINFGKSFTTACLAQFIFFGLYNNLKNYFRDNIVEREFTERLKEYTKQGVDLSCAHCGVKNYIPIRFDEDNDFKCASCDKTNGVYVNITSAQKTQMLDSVKLNLNSLVSNADDK